MAAPIIAFFGNHSGAGTTSLVYHLAWMFNDWGARVLAADLDPQASLSATIFDEDRLEQFWPEGEHPVTIDGCLAPLVQGTGDVRIPPSLTGESFLTLVGDLRLAKFEEQLSSQWEDCLRGDLQALIVVSAFRRILREMSRFHKSDIVLIDLGPNLGGINRAALVAADYVVVSLAPDLFSLQGLRTSGPTFHRWRGEWQEILKKAPGGAPELPAGQIIPIGYIVQQHTVRLDRPARSYDRWMNRIPGEYRKFVLQADSAPPATPRTTTPEEDPSCLAVLKHYRSLVTMAQEARKPMFHLKVADGAIGSHLQAAQSAKQDFILLAMKIADRAGTELTPF